MNTTAVRALAPVLTLSAALVLAACAGEAESALDEQSARLEPPAVAQQSAAVEPAAVTEEPSEPVDDAPAAAPTPAAPRPDATPRAERRVPTPRPAVAPGTVADAPAAPASAAPFIAAGTSIGATVDEELTTERSREGDRFLARTTEDVLGANGEVLLPAGSVLNGRVATSHASTGPNDLAALDVEIESITAADGRTLPVSVDVVELETEAQTRDSNTRTAAKVGIGAAAGAVVGRILGSDKGDAAKGAVVGAAAGAAVAVAQRDGHAVIKPGARMVLRLTERLIVSR
jgi:hypothetical protein